MASVVVRGTAATTVTPDRAQLSLEIAHRAGDPAAALDEVARRSGQLVEVLARHGLATADWSTDGVQVGEEYQWRDNQQVMTGYRAATTVTATVRAADTVGGLVRDGVAEVGASVRNLTWHVDRDNPARAALLADAARDAHTRATAYAGALGLRLGEVELISEMPIPAEPHPGGMRMAMDSAPMGAPPVEVSGGQIELSADVHVRFALLA
ncbi:MAG: hypothetical protein RL238_2365 [Actinomycetota bacterium]|jgi:uncharacterized protein